MSETEDVIFATWRYRSRSVTAETALQELRVVFAEFAGEHEAKIVARMKRDDIPFRAMSVPWFEYYPGSDVIEPVEDS